MIIFQLIKFNHYLHRHYLFILNVNLKFVKALRNTTTCHQQLAKEEIHSVI